MARYHYYMGRIKGIQLEYSEAHKHLIQALRKAPQQTAVGFRQSVQKLAVVVELLLGDIPERQVCIAFIHLTPYLVNHILPQCVFSYTYIASQNRAGP